MALLTKSKIQTYIKCPKQLWLDIHHADLEVTDATQKSIMDQGTEFGVIARTFYPGGELVDTLSTEDAVKKTQAIFDRFDAGEPRFPIYEAAFVRDDVTVRVDIMIPLEDGSWKIVEIKSGSVETKKGFKENLLFDAAIQYFVVSSNRIYISLVELGCPNKKFSYTELNNFNGLLQTFDVSEHVKDLIGLVIESIKATKELIKNTQEPMELISSSKCGGCGYVNYCSKSSLLAEEQFIVPSWNLASSPLTELVQAAMKQSRDLQHVADDVLTKPIHLQMKRIAKGEIPNYIDPKLVEHLNVQGWPRYFLDYEFLSPAIPVFLGTKPFERIPFQFSLHKWTSLDSPLTHIEFIADSKIDPRKQLIETLLTAFEETGPIFTWNGAKTEAPVTRQLISYVEDAAQIEKLNFIAQRCQEDDLYPWFQDYFYTPGMVGWGVKQVSRNFLDIDPYKDLKVRNGMGAVEAYIEFLLMPNGPEKKDLGDWLKEYCKTDTLVLINIYRKITDH